MKPIIDGINQKVQLKMSAFNQNSPLKMDQVKKSNPRVNKVKIRQSLFGDDISSLAHKVIDPSKLKPVSALDIPDIH